ncbi:penicillin-binding transpeptidase domain-containing protein [Kitasatospora sp. NPDC001175]|uniref:penicillin-binding transpeptidase domain-containing protein n=1 Tax=Kitasatospora sp. NPDC001175 TaxID=3157103 RepID=UPI003D01E30F
MAVGSPVRAQGTWDRKQVIRITNQGQSADGRRARGFAGSRPKARGCQGGSVSSAIADDGVLMRPSVVDRLTDHQGRTVEDFKPQQLSRVMSERTAGQLRSAMVTVVTGGTGTSAAVDGVAVGGKTGTAQNGVGNSGTPYAWFTSYADDGNGHRIAVAAVVVDGSADRADVTGGGLAAPVAKAVIKAAFGK